MHLRSTLWFFLPVLFVAACTKPPDVPRFAERAPTGPRRVLLGEDITGKDIREIFQAVNQNGKLDTLKPFLEEPDDATLTEVAKIGMATLTPSRWESPGLVGLLRERLRARSFTSFRESVARWRAAPGFAAERRFYLAGASDPSVPELAVRGKNLLSLDWHRWLAGVSREGLTLSGTIPEQSAAAVFQDASRFLASPAIGRLYDVADLIDQSNGGQSLLKALAEARAVDGATAFLGLGRGMSHLLSLPPGASAPPPIAEKLFDLLVLLDAPTEGLFTTAQRKFQERNNSVAREFASLFRPQLESAISGFLLQYLKEPLKDGVPSDKKFWMALIDAKEARPTKEFKLLHGVVREAIEQICGQVHGATISDAFLFNLPILVNTYALTRFIESVAIANRTAIDALAEKDFATNLLKLPVTFPEFKLDLLAADNTLSPDVKKELEALGEKKFAETLDHALKKEGYGDFYFPFAEQKSAAPFSETIREAVRLAEANRPFGDTAPLLRAVLAKVTRPDASSRFTLDKLESNNILDAVNRFVSVLDRDAWLAFKGVLFEDLELGNLGPDTKRLLLKLYEPGSDLQKRVEKLLTVFPSFLELDRRVDPTLPSLFESYTRVLAFTAPREIRWVGATMRWTAESKLLATEARGGRRQPDYPTLYTTAQNGIAIARMAYGLSTLPASARYGFLGPVSELFRTKDGTSGLRLTLEAVRGAMDREPLGATEFIRRLSEQGYDWAVGTDILSAGERDWAIRFVTRGQFETLWKFLNRHSTLPRFHDLILALERAVRDRTFREAAQLLLEIQDERIQLLARLLLEWEDSGQLMEFLTALETLSAP